MPKTYWIFGLPNQTARFGLPKTTISTNKSAAVFSRCGSRRRQENWPTGATPRAARLAEIIVLDQFSRNLFRNSPAAFAQDLAAVCLAQEAVRLPGFAAMKEEERHFILMPLMHSESRAIPTQAAALFERYTSEAASDFELRHKAVIDRFGRYPHRNAVLGRESTAEEQDFLSRPGSSF